MQVSNRTSTFQIYPPPSPDSASPLIMIAIIVIKILSFMYKNVYINVIFLVPSFFDLPDSAGANRIFKKREGEKEEEGEKKRPSAASNYRINPIGVSG